MLADLVRREAVNVGVAVPDELLGVLVQLLEVVRRVVQVLIPVESQPLDVGQYGFDVFDVLARRVGVVKPHVAARARKLLADAEIQAYRLGVPDVQVSVGLGREPRHHPPVVRAGGLVFGDDVADKIGGGIPRGCGLAVAHFP